MFTKPLTVDEYCLEAEKWPVTRWFEFAFEPCCVCSALLRLASATGSALWSNEAESCTSEGSASPAFCEARAHQEPRPRLEFVAELVRWCWRCPEWRPMSFLCGCSGCALAILEAADETMRMAMDSSASAPAIAEESRARWPADELGRRRSDLGPLALLCLRLACGGDDDGEEEEAETG